MSCPFDRPKCQDEKNKKEEKKKRKGGTIKKVRVSVKVSPVEGRRRFHKHGLCPPFRFQRGLHVEHRQTTTHNTHTHTHNNTTTTQQQQQQHNNTTPNPSKWPKSDKKIGPSRTEPFGQVFWQVFGQVGIFKDVRFYPILNFGLFWAPLFSRCFYPIMNFGHFWALPLLQDVRVSPHPIFSSILGRPRFFSC